VALRGRARCCGLPISPRYPAVELATAAAFALVGWWALQPRPDGAWPPREAALPALLYLAAVSIALAVIDIDTFRLPFWIVAPSYPVAAVLLAVASLTARDGGSVLRMLLGGAALWGVYRLLHAVYPGGMGYGDVRLAGVLGLYLGWLGWGTLVVGGFLGFLTGAVGGLAVVALRRGGLKTSIPYGPYMLAGAWLAIPFGDTVVRWYLTAAGLPTG
jgi:leader peptidase (prepilin peptidase)/N-methyltransferase